MPKKSGASPLKENDGIPRCRMCLNHHEDIYATMAFKTFPDSEEWSYCDVCGSAMASVIRDSQHRDPDIRKLTPPPRPVEPPKIVPPPVPVPPPPPPKTAPEPPRRVKVTDVAREVVQEDEHDLLALLGWKK